jgi:hypothetical protein
VASNLLIVGVKQRSRVHEVIIAQDDNLSRTTSAGRPILDNWSDSLGNSRASLSTSTHHQGSAVVAACPAVGEILTGTASGHSPLPVGEGSVCWPSDWGSAVNHFRYEGSASRSRGSSWLVNHTRTSCSSGAALDTCPTHWVTRKA